MESDVQLESFTMGSGVQVDSDRKDDVIMPGSSSRNITKQYQCPHCPKRYSVKGNLNTHMKIHDKSKQIKCEVCWKMFATKHDYTLHMRTHTGEKPYQCDICNRAFSRMSSLKIHQYTHLDDKYFKCPKCPDDRYFRSPHQLACHMTLHEEKRYECFECGKKFHRSGNLKIHERIHTKVKPYGCEFCEKRFAQASDLVKHSRWHTGEK